MEQKQMLDQCKIYELNKQTMEKALVQRCKHIPNKKELHKETIVKEPIQHTTKYTSDIFYPEQKDTLFWCFYVMKHGKEEYDALQNNNIVLEKRLKIEYVERLRVYKDKIKSAKKGLSMTHVENSLANDEKIYLKTFFALCILEKMHVMVVEKRSFIDFFVKDDQDDFLVSPYVLKKNEAGRYGYEYKISDAKRNEYKEQLFTWESWDKPLKAFSAYKTDDLVRISKALALPFQKLHNNKEKTMTKKEMYDQLVRYF